MLAILGLVAAAMPAQACERTDFERVVEEAALALRDVNLANKPVLQARLAELKQKRGWSNDQFIEKAAPLVQDQKISDYDTRSSTLLDRLQNGGQEGAAARVPDCALLAELKEALKTLIEVQKEKWAYMLGRIDDELKK